MWKQPKYPSIDEWVNKVWYKQTMEYHSTLKEILALAIMYRNLGDFTLIEISKDQRTNTI